MLTPRALQQGDTVAIVSPASAVDNRYIDEACEAIASHGWQPRVMPHARGRHGSYAAPADARLADITDAYLDPAVRAVMCSRGGYGAVHLLGQLDRYRLEADPKWLIGFSDISALHALMCRHGIVSVHASMCKGLSEGRACSPGSMQLFDILSGCHELRLDCPPHPLNRPGYARAGLRGGNLAVLQALIDTPFDDLTPGSVLLIEDIAEPIYKVERIMWQLKLSGRLEQLAGLIVGRFTDYRPDLNHNDMYTMIASMTASYDFPVIYDAPHGHIDANLPVLHGADTLMSVTPQGASIVQRF